MCHCTVHWRRVLAGIAAGIVLPLGIFPSPDAGNHFTIRPRLGAGKSPYVGTYFSAGVVLRHPRVQITQGRTFTDARGWEHLVALRYEIPVAPLWTLELGGASGEVIDDYRIDRYPEVTLRFGRKLSRVPLELTSEATVGNLTVHGLASATRTQFIAQLKQATLPLSSSFEYQIEALFRYRTYSSGHAQQALVADVRLFVNSIRGAPITFTYHRQFAQGSSPLAFDLMGSEHLFTGRIDIRLRSNTVFSFLQQQDLTTGSLADRWYAISTRLSDLYGTEILWNEVSQRLTVTVSRAGLGSIGISYTIPSQTFGLSIGN